MVLFVCACTCTFNVLVCAFRCWYALRMSGIGDNSLEPMCSDRKRKLSTCDTPGIGWVLFLVLSVIYLSTAVLPPVNTPTLMILTSAALIPFDETEYAVHTDRVRGGEVVLATYLILLAPRQVWQASKGTGEQVHRGAGWAHLCQPFPYRQLQREARQMCHPQGDCKADQTNQRARYHLY